ncbi:uncharacterized protein HD556DRAFT_1313610 [Suillus plorans]|uniref:Uncharacterized protein n=1 Tax=Suillus plorans TaxID=116603 RepID=A0A9P7DB65_9AGAM|nr:uncharacterized protein HD556DRAFT_1313610 [Suillus plorans]KAG1786261.1 hypothetical protein HD556DRAFT_1313610 [Suillus plorans]
MKEDIFCPVITIVPTTFQIYVYDNANYKSLELIDNTSPYALTGSIFTANRKALLFAQTSYATLLVTYITTRNALARLWVNNPLEEDEMSGTNDKAGSIRIFYQFVSVRSIKESFMGLEDFQYPSNLFRNNWYQDKNAKTFVDDEFYGILGNNEH